MMAQQFSKLERAHVDFITRQRIFFVASAAAESRVNMSPKSTDEVRVTGPHTIIYRDLTGSGNETAAHIRAQGRLTMMFCAFEGNPIILRLYGCGHLYNPGSQEYATHLSDYFANEERLGARRIVALDIDLVQTSCGYGVPLFDYAGERRTLDRWAQAKGGRGLEEYRRKENGRSIDGLPTDTSTLADDVRSR